MNKIIKKNKQLAKPYSKFFDSELPKYIDLCKDKIENYTYNQWKKDIIISLNENGLYYNKDDESKSLELIDNFYHYLRNQKRILENINKTFLPVMICFTSLLLSSISGLLPEGCICNILKAIIVIIASAICLKELLVTMKDSDLEYCFYCDLIEIVEEMKSNITQNNTATEEFKN